jgi:hypothetical protein
MMKDIPRYKMKNIALAVVPRQQTSPGEEVNSRGYGDIEGEKRRTTILRHFFERIEPFCAVQIEPIQTKLFDMTNEYWVSFVHDDYMFDKKYVFVKGSIRPEHFTNIPILNRPGVMIR